MIRFDPSKIRVEYVHLKYISKSLGGVMSVLDTSNKGANEKFIKIPVPTHVVDSFVNRKENMSRYIKPVLCAVCYYDNLIVALERYPLANSVIEEDRSGENWESLIFKNIRSKLIPDTMFGDWFIDGAVVYSFKNRPGSVTNLSNDGKFRAVEVEAYRLTRLAYSTFETATRTCIAYSPENSATVISPPIWTSLDDVGNRKVEHLSDDEGMSLGLKEGQFDKVDRLLAVNLNFALRASSILIDHFGYESIEPLRLDDLMVNLKTVNLPKLDRSIKTTYDIGLKFTHAIAWIIGLTAKDVSVETYSAVRSILRYLTSRGIVHRTALVKDNVFANKKDMNDVPLLNVEDIREQERQKELELYQASLL